MNVKFCNQCKSEKTIENFYKIKTGYYYCCKDCNRAKNRKRTKESRRKESIKALYGLTYDEFEAMLESQQHMCYICKKALELKTAGYAVDHCHKSGKVRKILCMGCNTLLGHSQDNIDILFKMINYLKEHE